jgi:hypothetical protein
MMNGDFEGKLAVRGGLRLRSFGVNQRAQCTAAESAGFGIVAQGPGSIDFSNGRLFCGNLLASNDSQIVNLPSFANNAGLVVPTHRSIAIVSFSSELAG